jgi:hypothetical protein
MLDSVAMRVAGGAAQIAATLFGGVQCAVLCHGALEQSRNDMVVVVILATFATLVHDHSRTGDGHVSLLHGTSLSTKYPLRRLDTPRIG